MFSLSDNTKMSNSQNDINLFYRLSNNYYKTSPLKISDRKKDRHVTFRGPQHNQTKTA